MKLEIIEDIQPEAWEKAISNFQARLIFHHSAWLRFIEETWGGKPLRLRIEENGSTIGYFVGFIVKKGLFTILGSPLTGWVTDYLGPIANHGFDAEEFLRTLENLCRSQLIQFVQIGNPSLQPDVMRAMGFEVFESKIFVIPLDASPDLMWRRLSGKCRNRIRKGIKNGLVVEACDNPSFVEEYYDQHNEVFNRQNLPPKYSIEVVRNLYRSLKPRDMLFTLRVMHEGRTVATGLFPHDDRSVYSFGIASRTSDLYLCPNELLYWTAMCLAGEQGINSFSIGSNYRMPGEGGKFKEKFNGDEVPIYRYSKSYSTLARIGHKAYQFVDSAKRRLHRAQRP